MIEQASSVEFLNHSLNKPFGSFWLYFSFMPGNNPVFRVYEHQCRPCTYSILPPEVHVPVIDDGMLDAVTQHGIADALRKLLPWRSEEHTSELQSPDHLVCR